MAITQSRSKRKSTGGRYKSATKKLAQFGSLPTYTLLGEESKKQKRARGGAIKQILFRCNKANVYNPATKKSSLVDIKNVVDNPANRNFVRRNIITQGAFIETALGKARVTSRPGQAGFVNAVLVK